ncbi:hypothetical protein, partial [Alistipes putredinis]|uniref:hypothetical protein n=1 Tax=Alistipes putredinis TaxID=28117 RepID=UPI00210D4B4F
NNTIRPQAIPFRSCRTDAARSVSIFDARIDQLQHNVRPIFGGGQHDGCKPTRLSLSLKYSDVARRK